MIHPFLRRQLLIFALLVGLMVLLPACGGMGDNEDDGDDGAFPEPPDRPNSALVVTPIPSPGSELGSLATGRHGQYCGAPVPTMDILRLREDAPCTSTPVCLLGDTFSRMGVGPNKM